MGWGRIKLFFSKKKKIKYYMYDKRKKIKAIPGKKIEEKNREVPLEISKGLPEENNNLERLF